MPVKSAGLRCCNIIEVSYSWLVPLVLTFVLWLVSQNNFLLFHTLAELFSISVAVIFGVVAWYTYRFSNNHYLVFLGTGYFWIAGLDLLHSLSFSGFNLIEGAGGNLASQYWVMSRYFEALLIVVAPFYLLRKINKVAIGILFGSIAVSIYLLVSGGFIPDTFIEGSGLTRFKLVSEYIIISLLVLGLARLYQLRQMMHQRMYYLVSSSIILTILAELSFTLYFRLDGFELFVGHIFKLLSYWLIFLAVVKNTLTEPFYSLTRASTSFDAIPDPTIVVSNAGSILQVNQTALKISGLTKKEVLGQHCHKLFHPENLDIEYCPICHAIKHNHKMVSNEYFFPEKNKYYELTLGRFDTEHLQDEVVHVMHDVTKNREMEDALSYSKYYDKLTGLASRTLVEDRLKVILENVKRTNTKGGVLFIDLDNFKYINETLGHSMGDMALVEVAHRLQSVRSGDTIGRWAGDGFVVIVPDATAISIRSIANKILEQFKSGIALSNQCYILSASIGIAIFPDDGVTNDVILSCADAAMYKSKADAKGQFRFYTQELNHSIKERLTIENELHNAIDKNEFFIHYQPKVDAVNGEVHSAEALLRWDNEQMGSIGPDKFVPIAEENGVIKNIGDWVLEAVIKDIAQIQADTNKKILVAINVSPVQLRDNSLLERIQVLTQQYKVDYSSIQLEVTESALINDEGFTSSMIFKNTQNRDSFIAGLFWHRVFFLELS